MFSTPSMPELARLLRADMIPSPFSGAGDPPSLSATPALYSPDSERIHSVFSEAVSAMTLGEPIRSTTPEFTRRRDEKEIPFFATTSGPDLAGIAAPMALRHSREGLGDAQRASVESLCDSEDRLYYENPLESELIKAKREQAQRRFLEARQKMADFLGSDRCPEVFKGIKQERLFALFIDGNRLNPSSFSTPVNLTTQMTFDKKEPGYTAAMMEAFIFLFSSDSPLNADFIERLHDIAIHDVDAIVSEEALALDKGYRGHHSNEKESFGLELGTTLSATGFSELLAKLKDERYSFTFNGLKEQALDLFIENPRKTIDLEGAKKSRIVSRAPRVAGILKASINHLIHLYQEEPKTTKEEKLEAIFRFLQAIEQIHPFYDGNIRTFMVLLLQKLLVDQGLEPAWFNDPNCLDCLSIDELKDKYEEASIKYRTLKED